MHISAVPAWLASNLYYSLWPRLRPNGYIGRLMRTVRERIGCEWNSPDEVWSRQRGKINALLDHAITYVPYYRQLAQAGKMPHSIEHPDDMTDIPLLTKAIIQSRLDDLVAENFPRHLLRRNATGGSTGQPLHFWSDESVSLHKNAAEIWADSLAGMDIKSSVALLWGAGRFEPSSRQDFKECLVRLITNRMFINCFHMAQADLQKAHKRLTRFQPEGFVGYSSALVEFAAFLECRGIKPRYPRKAVLSAAETLEDDARLKLQRVFPVPVYNRYGSREIGLIAMECDHHHGLHINCEDVFIELIDDPEIPSLKRIIVTKLNQFSMPFIRYDIEDLSEGPISLCTCRRGYPVLKKIVGRVTETIRLPDGASLPGEIFPHLFKDCGIVTYQVTQAPDYSLDVALVKAAEQTLPQDERLRRVIADHVGHDVAVTVRYVDHIDRSRTGKLLPVISHAPFRTRSTTEDIK